MLIEIEIETRNKKSAYTQDWNEFIFEVDDDVAGSKLDAVHKALIEIFGAEYVAPDEPKEDKKNGN